MSLLEGTAATRSRPCAPRLAHETRDPLLPLLRERGERVFEMDSNPTAENIARLIYEHAKEAGLPVVEVLLWETEHCFSTYSQPR